MNRDTYRQSLAALLADADRLGSTPDDLAARAVVLAELRHAIAAGLVEEPAPTEQPKLSRVRLVWAPAGEQWLLGPHGCNAQSAYYIACDCDVSRYPGGRPTPDKVEWCQGLPNALRRAADMARADGYECDEHPDAAPATAGAPPLPPSR